MYMKDYTINIIEALTISEAKQMALETMKIKEHECIFVDFGGYFGYSVLVFKNGKHVYHANDYELLHRYTVRESGREGLRQFYIDSLNHKLYTESELMETVKSYEEYQAKSHYLRNYYIMQFERLSSVVCGKDARQKFNEGRKTYTIYNPVSFCYMEEKDRNSIERQAKICSHLEEGLKRLKDTPETFREMIRAELYNHEACITCSYTEALAALDLSFEELTEEKQKIVLEELEDQIHEYNNRE